MIELPIEKYALVWFLVFTRGLRKTIVSNLIQYSFRYLPWSVYTNLTQKMASAANCTNLHQLSTIKRCDASLCFGTFLS